MTQLDLLRELDALGVTSTDFGYKWPLPPLGEIIATRETWAKTSPEPMVPPPLRFHGWRVEDSVTTGAHNLTIYSADHRCYEPHDLDYDAFRDGSTHHCIGELIFVARCDPCGWQTTPRTCTNPVVEIWHDHAWPGWRDLPPIPLDLQKLHPTTFRPVWKKNAKWRAENYGAEWDQPGAPVVTEREPYASRHVPSRSPHGGYDLSPDRATEATP